MEGTYNSAVFADLTMPAHFFSYFVATASLCFSTLKMGKSSIVSQSTVDPMHIRSTSIIGFQLLSTVYCPLGIFNEKLKINIILQLYSGVKNSGMGFCTFRFTFMPFIPDHCNQMSTMISMWCQETEG